jgi:hypothetical protein
MLAPNIEDQYAKETAFLSSVKKNVGVEKVNNKFIITVIKSMHSGTAAVAKGATLPTGYAATARVEIAPTYIFTGYSVDDQDLEMARESAKSLADLMTINEEQMRSAHAKQMNRMFLQNGDGAITTANGAGVSSTTLILSASSPNGDIPATKYFAPGQYIKIGTGAPVQIASVDSATQLTLSAARSWSNTNKVYVTGPDGDIAVEPTGLADAIGNTTNTFQTIDRTTNPWWVPTVFSTPTTYSTARALEYKLEDLILQSNEYGKVNAMFMNRSAYRRLAADFQSIQRVVNSVNLEGGFKGLAFNGPGYDVACVLDYDAPDGVIYGVDFSTMTQAQLAPLQWLELDGSGNVLRLQGKATWEGFLKHYINLGLRKARGNFTISGGTFTV